MQKQGPLPTANSARIHSYREAKAHGRGKCNERLLPWFCSDLGSELLAAMRPKTCVAMCACMQWYYSIKTIDHVALMHCECAFFCGGCINAKVMMKVMS
jgi:hypothetical protein